VRWKIMHVFIARIFGILLPKIIYEDWLKLLSM